MSGLDGLHDELRKVARDLLGSPGRAGDGGEPGALDWALAAELGWPGLEVPELLGGSGATFAEVAVVAEELGRASCASPHLGTVVLGVGALLALEPGAGRDELLAGIAAGEATVAVVLPTGDDAAGDVRPAFQLGCDGAGLVLDGDARFVPDVAGADRLLVLATEPDGVPVVLSLDPAGRGLEVGASPVLDASRSLSSVTATAAPVADGEVWRFAGDPAAAAERLVLRGALGVAVDCLGVAEAMLAATVAYAGVRHQFGRPIGSFQAVKHACADMLVQLSLSRELVAVAVADVVAEAPTAATSVAMAKAHAGTMAVEVAGAAMQLHGGIGYTWESGVPRHLKRAALDRSLFGSPAAHRRAIARRYRAEGAESPGSRTPVS